MRLIIDFGNTLCKVAFYENDEELNLRSFSNINLEMLQTHINKYINLQPVPGKITHCIVSSVINYPAEIKAYLQTTYQFIELSPNTPLPISIKYETPNTLGNDRIAAVVGGKSLFPDQDLLIVDAGTCITFDFLNKNGDYLGGAITPGIKLRFKSLNNYTDKLPLIMHFGKDVKLIGSSTEGSIKSGVINGVKAEVNGIIENYREEYPEIKIIFTGGDINYFDTTPKNNIFAVANLVLKGLNTILNYNAED
ncbi:MAG: pantothenate kinase [Bacteroidetes bacterium]|nr:MAG: pantothenate kinase [Bacteroidota bacterium]